MILLTLIHQTRVKNKARHRGVTSGSFMESFLLVLNKAAKLIAPFKATESKVVVLAALTDVFIEHGFSLEQSLILSVKAYEIA